ncbi:uncharacterized protein HD556DRAFT_1357222 [Suillus plorans]|uniref:Uncharacterized protein n=1 Tax=Suillus plorans TaxID=116603 RepID=A0A9P7DL54_9AGAM|nr:uncharacterized protein HD556DRAFT_1357222 [Suillus plorans]KAG1797514.1 hypothetical protein HD556DRAFT_1357222 [Suillus plorans]
MLQRLANSPMLLLAFRLLEKDSSANVSIAESTTAIGTLCNTSRACSDRLTRPCNVRSVLGMRTAGESGNYRHRCSRARQNANTGAK